MGAGGGHGRGADAAAGLGGRAAGSAPDVRAVVERWVGPGKFPGMVASLGLPGQETEYRRARRPRVLSMRDPMTPDSLFRIYSMTKPITGMAAMMLIDEGKLGSTSRFTISCRNSGTCRCRNVYDGSITALHPAPDARSPSAIC